MVGIDSGNAQLHVKVPYQPKGDIFVAIPLADDLKGGTAFGISKKLALGQGLFYVSAARGGSQQVCRGGR